MSKISLTSGQDIVVLGYTGNSYLNNAAVSVGSTFSIHGLPVVPIVDECESDGAQTVEINTSDYITDSNGNNYPRVVGGRPKTRARH